MSELAKSLTSGRRLAGSAVWSFVGMAAPLFVGLIAIPLLIEGMGKERFGLLTIIWMGVGYFSLFDMGLGRALTKLVAERLGSVSVAGLGSLIWTGLSLIIGLGVVGAIILLIGVGPLIRHLLNVPSELEIEAINAFRVLALGLPAVTLTSAMIGLLEAHQKFANITAVRIPLGFFTFGGPLLTLQFTPSLIWATGALLLARLVAAVTYFCLAASLMAELKRPCLPNRAYIIPLFHFGGWLTITNIVGPLMVYFDRILIGALLTMTDVTFYVTPYEVVSRARMLPKSIMAVLFPAMTTAMATNRHRLIELYSQSSQILLLLMLPVAASFFFLAPEALNLWLGTEFQLMSTPIVRWLALGLLVNTLARPPFTILQSAGLPDLVAKIHLIELLPYGLLLWSFTLMFGISGTAMAWFFRVLVDTLLLNETARRRIPEIRVEVGRTYVALFGILVMFATASLIDALVWRITILVIIYAYTAIRAWPIFMKLRKGGGERLSL